MVGYLNIPLTNGYTFVVNPLNHTSGGQDNSLTNIIPIPPNGTKVYLWDVTNQVFMPPATFSDVTSGWDRNFDLPVGKGFVVYSPEYWTNTFVGNVLQGALTNFVAGSNKFSLLGSKVPVDGPISSALAFPGIDGANVYQFPKAFQKYTDSFTYFAGFGWFDPTGTFDAQGPFIKSGESFFVQNPGPNTNWVRTFFVQVVSPPSKSLAGAISQAAPQIRNMALKAGTVRLEISNPSGGSFSVEFSTDGTAWKAVATSRTGNVWIGPASGGLRGYYRLTTP